MNRLYALILFLLSGTPFVQAQSPVRVNTGNHSLEMISAGTGPYTIIFESGFGTDYKVWGRVAAGLLQDQSVVLYSRAGTGQSDPVENPGLKSAVADLNALVEKAGLRGPLILVGHSYGAFVIRGFAASHPDRVKGMVFVDPAHERLMIELSKVDPKKTAGDQEIQSRFTPEPYRKENDRINQIFKAGRLPDFGKLPDVPAMILTSVQKRPNPELFLHEPQGVAVWRKLHAEFFSGFTSGAHWVTPNSGHHIQRDEPQLVIRAIRQVIDLAEQEKERQDHAWRVDAFKRALKDAAGVKDPALAEKRVFDASGESGLAERDLNSIAYSLLKDSLLRSSAVMLLKSVTVRYPTSANAFDSYGEGLLTVGRTGDARAQFLKAIELAEAAHDEATLQNSRMNLKKIDGQ